MKRLPVIGKDPAFKATLALAKRVAPGRSPVVIVGPTGSGKSQLAHLLHLLGPHPAAPFLEWNAGEVPETLLEAALLGVSRGAATGVSPRPGLFETAGEGTVCLAGVEHLSAAQQAILLRVIEHPTFERVGGGTVKSRARILAAFAEPPEGLVGKRLLRPDLLFRLDVIRLELPPLVQRSGDVPALATHFLKSACRGLGRPAPGLSGPLLEALSARVWPGNLRELSQCMEGLALSGLHDPLTVDDLPSSFWLGANPVEDALRSRLTLAELKDAYIRSVLARVGGNRSQAARWLGVSRKALWVHLSRDRT